MSYRWALCSEVFQTGIDEAIDEVARLGFEGIEIAPFQVAADIREVDGARRREIRQRAADRDLEIVGLHWLLVSPPGLHLTCEDPAPRREAASFLRALAKLCADLGGEVLVLGSPKQRNLESDVEPALGLERAAEVLREAAGVCVDEGVRILIEALNPKETNFLRTIEEALELRDRVGSPGVDFMLDVKAMSGMPEGIEGTIRRHGGACGHFHANDPSGKGPGMGDLDFAPVLAALRESGYRGWVSSEPFDYQPDSATVARTALETLRRAEARASS